MVKVLRHKQSDVLESVKKNDVAINNYYEISSLSEMSSYLEKLQRESSGAVAEAVNAQLAVVRFVQSPTLNDTLLDTLLMGLETAISYSQTEEDKAIYRRHFALMIQNYVFFLDAKIQYEVEQHQEEAYRLLDHAGEMLSKSVVKLAELYATKGTSALKVGMANLVVKNVFAQENEKEKKSFFKKFFDWYNKKVRISKKKDVFYDTLERIYFKFDEYSELIGPSILIKGLLERYIVEMANKKYDSEIFSYYYFSAKKYVDNAKNVFWRLVALGGFSFVIRFFLEKPASWFLSHLIWVLFLGVAYILIAMVVYFIKYYYPKKKIEKKKKLYITELYNIANKFKG